MFKKSLSFALAITMMFSILTAFPLSFNAKEADIIYEGVNIDLAETGNPYEKVYQDVDGDGYREIPCTYVAWQKAYEVCGVELPSWSHANTWYSSAQAAGILTGTEPRVNSIACFNSGYYGHVSFVTAVNNDNTMNVIEGGRYDLDRTASQGVGTSRPSSIVGVGGLQGFIYLGGSGNNPTSALDSVLGGTGTVRVSGWTFDRDDPTQSLSVHVYIGGSAGTPGAEGVSIPANQSRGDVDNAFHVGEFHGFDTVIPTSKTGNQDIYVYAINIGGGQNTEIDHKTVYISPDTEKPTCNISYLSQVTHNSFRVCAVPNDNVGIKEVRIATWTQSDQSDLIWHTASFNGSDTYFVNVNRADYSNNKNSLYYNHIYVYDYAGNYISIACNQDYKISSDTGKSVPEGEYRIATAINESRALDVANGSADSGANIQIYANFVSPKQTFILSYLNNGFYTIANSFSGLVLDVTGDTYVNNTNVMQHVSNGGANQEWMIKSSGDGYYYIISRTNGLALDVTNADDRDGANVAVHTQNQSTAQKWKLRRVLNDNMVKVDAIISKENATVAKSSVTVTVDDNVLTEGIDYSLTTSYDSNTKALTATVIGLGNYCDTVTKTVTATLSVPKFLGDADGNGTVNITDATIIQRYLTGLSVSYPKETLMNADVNGDGVLTIIDATLIQRHVTMIDTPYPIGKPKT